MIDANGVESTAAIDTTAPAAPVEAAPAKEEDPFAGFNTEEFKAGEKVAPAEAKPNAEAKDADAPDDQPKDGEPAKAEDAGKPKPKQTVQERINELTKARRDEERKREALEFENAELRAKLAEPVKKGDAAKPAAEKKESEPKGPPKPEDYEFGELDSRYITDLVDYKTDQRLAEFTKTQAKKDEDNAAADEQRAAQERFQARVEAGSQKYDDFYEKVVVGAEKLAWPLSPDLGLLIVDSEVGDEIAYHLATNVTEAELVFRMPPLEQARWFGKMETRFSAAQSAADGGSPAKETAPAKTPKAPPPVLPARGTGGKFQATAASSDFKAFEAVAMGEK